MAARGVIEAGNLCGSAGEVRTVAFGAGTDSAVGNVGFRGGFRVLAAGGNHPTRWADHAVGGFVGPASCDPGEGSEEDQMQSEVKKIPDGTHWERRASSVPPDDSNPHLDI